MCWTDFITVSPATPSESGLYVTDLPGITIATLDGVTKDEQDDFQAYFESLYRQAQINLKIDVQKALAQRFHIDKKLVSRETSEYLDSTNGSGALSGVKIKFDLPKYARVQILSIGFYAEESFQSPQASFFVYDTDENGELLSTISSEIAVGRNVKNVYQSFEVDELFIAYNADQIALRQTQNKYYNDTDYYDNVRCVMPCLGGAGVSVQQINGGGLNVKFIITCSMEKMICENLPLFQYALWYRIGVDLMKERKVSDRVTRFTVISEERAVELMAVYNEDYQAALSAATMNIKFTEDPVCFLCKQTIAVKTSLP